MQYLGYISSTVRDVAVTVPYCDVIRCLQCVYKKCAVTSSPRSSYLAGASQNNRMAVGDDVVIAYAGGRQAGKGKGEVRGEQAQGEWGVRCRGEGCGGQAVG